MTTELTQSDRASASSPSSPAGPKVISDAYIAWQQSERQAFEARRARRDLEVHE